MAVGSTPRLKFRLEMVNVLAALAGLARIAAGLQGNSVLTRAHHALNGISSGFALLGNVGSAATPDYTALGDEVNRAFRLESATKDAGSRTF